MSKIIAENSYYHALKLGMFKYPILYKYLKDYTVADPGEGASNFTRRTIYALFLYKIYVGCLCL